MLLCLSLVNYHSYHTGCRYDRRRPVYRHNQLAKNKRMNQVRRLQQEVHNSTTNPTITPCVMLSGTVWMQEIVPLILSQGDPVVVDTVPNWDRVPWLEARAFIYNLDQRPSPRVFVTHFQYNMMSTGFFKVKPRVCYAAWSHTSSLRKDINQWKCP